MRYLHIQESEAKEVAHCHADRSGIFEVEGGILRESMVSQVRGEEHVGVKPSEEGNNAHEKSVQELGLENVAMTEFMHGIDEKV